MHHNRIMMILPPPPFDDESSRRRFTLRNLHDVAIDVTPVSVLALVLFACRYGTGDARTQAQHFIQHVTPVVRESQTGLARKG